jgi:anaerobic ribonucleoside-triphosphate reductase activating protein
MRVNSIIKNDAINSSNGFTLSLWLQHCPHKCSGCYNTQTWSKEGGYDISIDDVKKLILESRHKNVSFLGGEPLSELNRKEVIELIKWIKKEANKTIYVWTGYLKEEVDKWVDTSIIDYLIDGKFIKEELNLKLKLRSSNNQRIFKNGKLILDII